MPDEHFSPDEDRLWRALIRVSTVLPRALDDELERTVHLSLTEFGALLHLAEAGEDGLRMNDLAAATDLSPSRITRVVAQLLEREWAEKSRSNDDARGNLAVITALGREQFERAYPVQVRRAREVLFEHITPETGADLAHLLEELVKRVREPARVREVRA
jgi:DNA-binding MarR family transcriptional regulator